MLALFYRIPFFIAILFYISCNIKNIKKLPTKPMYFLFKYPKEILNNYNQIVGYEFLDFSKNAREKDTLVSILQKYGWQFHVTLDNEVLIGLTALQDADNLLFLNSELEKRIKLIR